MNRLLIFLGIMIFLAGCKNNENQSDAYGNFEATEILISAEGTGKLLKFEVEEGKTIDSGVVIGFLDTIQLYLKQKQVIAQQKAVSSKVANILSQIEVYKQQKATLLIEKERTEKLLKESAATQQMLDNINGQINVIDKQINAVEAQNAGVLSEVEAYRLQTEQIADQLKRCYIVNPVSGTILKKYFEQNELVTAGKSLYKIADLTKMKLRVYVSGSQLPAIKTGDEADVIFDKNETENQTVKGRISRIASQAEFTPKIIQTKEERVNLVYAVDILVNNTGAIKIGMPGEVKFKK